MCLTINPLCTIFEAHTSSSISKDDITVVIPVKDEELAISSVIDELLQEGYNNILVVDGYSKDKTLEIIKERKIVKFISQHGSGKTGAIKTAIENVTTPYLLVIDGDYTYQAKDIQRLLNHCRSYAQVIGARDRANIKLVHRFGNWIITRTFNLLFGAYLSDVCSGMYLLNTKVAKQLELNSEGFITEVEIAAQITANNSLTEVPISYRLRLGKAKLSAFSGFSILSAVVKLAWRYNPLLLLSSIASITMIPALCILGWVVYAQIASSIWYSGWALIGVFLMLFASQSLLLAAVSALIKRMENRITHLIENG